MNLIKYKTYDKVIDLQKQYKNNITFIYTDGSYYEKQYKNNVQYLPSYAFIACRPNIQHLNQFPSRSTIIYKESGDSIIPAIPNNILLGNKNITGEYFAVFKK